MALIPVQPSPIARRLLWHVHALGWGTVSSSTREGNYVKAGAQILWLRSGQGEFRLEGRTLNLRPGPLFWIFTTRQRRSWFTTSSFVVSSIRFGGPGLEAWLEEFDAARRPEFHLARPPIIHNAQKQLIRIVRQQSADWELMVHLTLSKMLWQLLLTRKTPVPAQSSLPGPVVKVLNVVASNPDRAWKATELAPVSGVSYSHLRELFRRSMHESLHDFLQQARLDPARRLLAEGKLGVKEIVEKLQFGSEFYFSRFFKAHTGISPSHYRKHAGLI